MTWIVAVTAGKWQKHAIRQAKLAGFKIVTIDDDPHAEGFSDSDLALCMDIFDVDGIQKELSKHKIRPDGVSSFTSEAGMKTAAALRTIYSLPGISLKDIDLFINKATQRHRWGQHNVPGPKWFKASTTEEFQQKVKGLKFPVIVKPADGSGSRGITKLSSHHGEIEFACNEAFKSSQSNCIIVEEFINGTEYTAEVFADRGVISVLAITQKKKVAGTNDTVALELASPMISIKKLQTIKSAVKKAYQSLNLQDGPGHIELIITDQQEIFFVEAAGRGGGFMVFDKLVPAISGVNIALATALNACGKQVGELMSETISPRNSAVLRFIPSKPGKVVGIDGFDNIRKIDNVEAESFVQLGDLMSSAVHDGDRMGYIFSQAKTPKDALELANKAEQLITFTVT
jgi:biotin carboxylase